MSRRRSEQPEEESDLEAKLSQIEDEISSQSSVLNQMQEAMDELPTQIRQIQQRLDELSASMSGVPAELEEKGALLAEIDTVRLPEPPEEKKLDWGLQADVRIGRVLRIVVYATFGLGSVADALGESSAEPDLRLQRILSSRAPQSTDGALGPSGRLTVKVHNIEVRKCRIRGAPQDAERTLVLSPEAGIPIVQEGDQLSFDFAPVLTIKNAWQEAEIPTIRPMGEEIQVPLEEFQKRESFSLRFSLKDQGQRTTVRLYFDPLRES